jgi:hypothetical protein
MGSCLVVEVREPPALYYRRSGQPRPTFVRPENTSAYRSPEDFRTFHTRDDDYYNDQHRSPTRFRYPNERPFEPLPPRILPPPVPPAPVPPTPICNNGDHQANPHNEIQVIDGPVETIPRWPRTNRRRRALVAPPQPRRYDDSDDDSWVGGRRGRRYSDDSWMEVNRPLRLRSSRRRSRSRNNSRYYL